MSKTKQRVAVVAAGALFLGGSGVAVAAADLPVPGQPVDESTSATATASPAADATTEAEAPATEDEPSEPERWTVSETADSPRQAWADEQVELWIERSAYADPWSIVSSIESWSSPEEGELTVTLDPSIVDGRDDCQRGLQEDGTMQDTGLQVVTRTILSELWEEPTEVESVTAETTDGQCSSTRTRDEYVEQYRPDL